MKLANPIYDAAFKYLLEDTEIAKGLIGRIIGEEIVEMDLKPKEFQVKNDKYVVVVLRMDFKAIIKTKEGKHKKVLIEIQKGKQEKDILRFRRYLSDNYRAQDEITQLNGEITKKDLPVIPIYFLGFRLKTLKSPVIKAERYYKDLVTNQTFTTKEKFIESLTHDGYFIQIPRLHKKDRNELERVLKVFNQSYKSSDNRLMEISKEELEKDPLLQKIGDRLFRAAADDDVLIQMDLEDEVEERIEKELRKLAALEEKVEEIEKTIEEKEAALEESKAAIEEKDAALEEKDAALEEKNAALEAQKLKSTQQLIEHTELSDKQIAGLQGLSVDIVRNIRKQIK